MYAFHQVVKGLTTKRMQQGKIIMRKVRWQSSASYV